MSMSFFAFSSSFMLGLSGLALHRSHLISALLCLEGMMLSLYIALSLWTLQLNSTSFSSSSLFLLAFTACESSTGLALVVATARTHGTDHLKALNLLQC
nr:NADH dehydrogenase subunit 4L [Centropomus undecimalis]